MLTLCPNCKANLASLHGSAQPVSFCPSCGVALGRGTIDAPEKSAPPVPNSRQETITEFGSVPEGPPSTLAWDSKQSGGPSGKRRDQEPLPTIPGYEILAVLGRGGMGVVYKARHLSLKRLVALKMILVGAHAGEETRERFRKEAEAAARFQHPNLVQIYEVNELEGLPYFSLEFVEGGNLARKIAGKPLAAEEAARLLEALARAVHYAHQNQVVHRDLKPANVLLTSDGQPKITDFGLAKQLDDVGQTQSGQIMGTPGYMAPEQAAGRVHEVSPATDVYALGAILYEMLTGQPPFREESVIETLEKVRTQDPTPPSKRNPQAPRDLETICLKCLAKAPASRYSSALALAQDVELFRAGEPIKARPEGFAGRLWRKVRRRPRMVASVAVGLLVAAVAVGYFALQASESSVRLRETGRLVGLLEQSLAETAWTPEKREGMVALIAELNQLAPAQAALMQQRFHKTYADSLRAQFAKKLLDAEEVAALRLNIDWLAARDDDEARRLRQELEDRLVRLEPIFSLRPPFTAPESATTLELFPNSGPIVAVDNELQWKSFQQGQRRLLTNVECRGNVELKAVFSPAWETDTKVGLTLNATHERLPTFSVVNSLSKGYEFTLTSPSSTKGTTLGDARKKDGVFLLRITRNGMRLSEQAVKATEIKSGPLRLEAKRTHDELVFQVNGLAPVTAVDLYPFSGAKAGTFGVLWPKGVGLTSLSALRQALPPAPSPLELADELYAGGRLDEALAEYRIQGSVARDEETRHAARYKEGVCLVQLRQLDAAARLFETFVREGNKRWSLLASCQLWVIRLRQDRQADAEAVFESLSAKHSFEDLAVLVPDDVLLSVHGAYLDEAKGVRSLLTGNPRRVRNLERAVLVEKLFRGDNPWAQFHLFRAYTGSGRLQDARATAEALLRHAPDLKLPFWLPLSEEYSWLLRIQGEPENALAFIDSHLFDKPGQFRTGREVLLVERARVLAALNRWKEAEADIEAFLRLGPKANLFERNYHVACLMRGFFCEQRKDEKAAQAAWREPVSMIQLAKLKPDVMALSGTSILAMLSLSGGLSEFEVRLANLAVGPLLQKLDSPWGEKLAETLPPELPLKAVGPLVRELQAEIPPAAQTAFLRKLFSEPDGRKIAKQFAFQELPVHEMFRELAVHFLVRAGDDLLIPGEHSADREAVLRTLATSTHKSATEGHLSGDDLLRLGMSWRGVVDVFGWEGVADSLRPYAEFRGPAAYCLGLRCRKLNRPADAERLFRMALADAPPESPLARLARKELEK